MGKVQQTVIQVLLWLVVLPSLAAQQHEPPYRRGEILVQLLGENKPGGLLARAVDESAGQIYWGNARLVSRTSRIWLLQIDSTQDDYPTLLWLNQQPEVLAVQRNHYVEERQLAPDPLTVVLPNDPLFNSQWQLQNTGQNGGLPGADLGAVAAWDIATGGVTPAGDTIVVAVMDGGIKASHADWGQNLWANWAEIPNDEIDNDNNGYVDDRLGWNVLDLNDNIAGVTSSHGTSVSGIIGARGNNNTGVTGVNWNTKIMFVATTSPFGTSEAEVLAGYDYVLNARRRYNASQGQQGAFVVAVNCSFGINYGQPTQSPLWCNMLDTLGQTGILTIGATANGAWDVDQVGDIPSTCPSDFLIAVTSLNRFDQKAPNAAWGSQSIDLGSYGSNVFTTITGAQAYGEASGTSFAAPQVSGAVGLLYSSPCPNLIALAKANPALGAFKAKNLILNAVQSNSALSGITVTNGRLHLGNTLQQYELGCQPCPAPYWLTVTNITTNSAQLNWLETTEFQAVSLRWRVQGTGTWTEISDANLPWNLENLSPCTVYEFATRADCGMGELSGWSDPVAFTTDGCCLPPSGLTVSALTANSAIVSWQGLTAADWYTVRVRPQGGDWLEIGPIGVTQVSFSNLAACTSFEVQVQSLCGSQTTSYCSAITFQTTGCGACTDQTYCPAKGQFTNDEWIALVEIGPDWQFESNPGGSGYQNFTGNGSTTAPGVILHPDEFLTTTITPGYLGFPYPEMFRIFVDFNLDGDFDDPGELAFDPAYSEAGAITGTLVTPSFTAFGTTRLRVMMKFQATTLDLPGACEVFEFGQVEDYCAILQPAISAADEATTATTNSRLRIFPQPAGTHATVVLPGGIAPSSVDVTVYNATGTPISSQQRTCHNGQLTLENLNAWPSGIYFVQVRSGAQVFHGKLTKI